MPPRLFFVLVLLPLADLASLAWLSWQTHWTVAIGLVVAAGLLGAYLVRWVGPRQFHATVKRVSHGEAPAGELLDGVSFFAAGVLLISPGFLSDAAALALLFPPTRRFIRDRISRSIEERLIRSLSAMARRDDHGEFSDDAVVDAPSRPSRIEEIDPRGRGEGRSI